MTEQRKFCKDCKHYKLEGRHARCYHPMALGLVDGNPSFCETHRGGVYELSNYCGPSGRWHEPRVKSETELEIAEAMNGALGRIQRLLGMVS